MPNPFNVINPMVANMGIIQNAYKEIMGAKNPMQVFSSMAMNNPQLQPILSALQGGANPQQIFNNLCKQRGIEPNAFLNQNRDIINAISTGTAKSL